MNDPKQTQTIRVAVWNLRGPSYLKKSSKKTAAKIDYFAQAVQPDLAFYLEAPVGTVEPLPRIIGSRYCWVGPDPEHGNLQGSLIGHAKEQPDAWAMEYSGNPKGILAVRHTNSPEVSVEDVQYTDPRGAGKTAMKVDLLLGGRPLRIIAVWMTPANTSQQKDFIDCLKEALAKFMKPEENVPCIIAGDTNVNLDSQNAAPNGENSPEDCLTRREQFVLGPLSQYGLTLLNPPGVFTHRKYEQEKKTGKIIHQSFFQCDLLMASHELVNASGAEAITLRVLSMGGRPEGLGEEFERWGSDHLPLIFEISVPYG